MTTFATPVPHVPQLVRITPSFSSPALRFAGDPLMWLGLPAGTRISAFATGAVARAQGASQGLPDDPGSAWTLFQLSPLPQLNPAAFMKLAGGLPVQLVLVAGTAGPSPAADDRLKAGDPLALAPPGSGSTAFLTIAFQDRLCRDPLTWAHAIAASGACDAAWTARFIPDLSGLAGAGNLRILDWCGRPLTSGTAAISIDAGPAVSVDMSAVPDGDTGISVLPGSRATVALVSAAHPIVAPGDADDGQSGAPFQLAAGALMAQVLDAGAWLAAPDDGVKVARWWQGNLVEPIQEGTPYFTQLVSDLRKAKPGGAVEFAGWAFVKGSKADSSVDWSLIPGDNSTTLLSLIEELRNSGVTVGMLINKFLQFDSPTLDDFQWLGAVLFAVYLALLPLPTLLKLQTDPAAYMLGCAAVAAASTVLASSFPLDLLRKNLEFSQDFKNALDAFDSTIATWTPYPAVFADNPIVALGPVQILGNTIDDISHSGVYHQKYVNIQFPGDDVTYTTYLGGIDINSDRPDTTIHRALHPYHDVQIRLQGPAVADAIRSYRERATFHSASVPIPAPAAGAIPAAGHHLVQIARTYFKPAAGSPARPFDFAPNGETTPARTIKAAIGQARDFIYIEDQYFTPPDDYVTALTDAAASPARALFITLPYQTDQPWGGQRRTAVLAALADAWGPRLHVGTPFRRPLHEVPVLTTNLGRMRLARDLDQGVTQCLLSPVAHIPSPPFWAFIGGELVLAARIAGAAREAGSDSSQLVEIVRAGGTPDWGANATAHPAGSPVLAVQVPGIYVHAKLMIVDDIFLFIGSSNINRRGLYHDGEMDSFTIPEHLRGDPRNPARLLRSRLMAEHAGLSPEMGQALFADPLSAIPYFTSRSWYAGAPRQSLSFLGSEPETILNSDSIGTWVLSQAAGAIKGNPATIHDVWPLLVDPTTSLDPTPGARGPGYP